MVFPQGRLRRPCKCGQLLQIFVQLLPFHIFGIVFLDQIAVFSKVYAVYIFLKSQTL